MKGSPPAADAATVAGTGRLPPPRRGAPSLPRDRFARTESTLLYPSRLLPGVPTSARRAGTVSAVISAVIPVTGA